MLRVIGGKYRHRLLKQPSLEVTRSTKDRAKEGLFNSLGDISGANFLDLFSGSGAIGIEAYSRGAKNVFLNDIDPTAYKIINENISSLKIDDIFVYNFDYLELLDALAKKELRFDYVFLDPPYKMTINNDFLEKMYSQKLIDNKTIIIIESNKELGSNDFINYNIKVLKYGISIMNILRRKI
ncbi:MAG: 16S rRNA (guanine(966)-N(2))-methyltransferase RsmD [Bacilli bacterium]